MPYGVTLTEDIFWLSQLGLRFLCVWAAPDSLIILEESLGCTSKPGGQMPWLRRYPISSRKQRESLQHASNMKAWGLNGTGFHSGQRALEPRGSDGGADEHSHVQLPSKRVHHDATPVSDFDQSFEQLPIPSLGGDPQLDSRKPGG